MTDRPQTAYDCRANFYTDRQRIKALEREVVELRKKLNKPMTTRSITRPDHHCQKCGCETKGEEAWINEQIWCHPCADKVSDTSHIQKSQGE